MRGDAKLKILQKKQKYFYKIIDFMRFYITNARI